MLPDLTNLDDKTRASVLDAEAAYQRYLKEHPEEAPSSEKKKNYDRKHRSDKNANFDLQPLTQPPRAPYGSMKHTKTLPYPLTCTRCGKSKASGYFYHLKATRPEHLAARQYRTEWCKLCFKKYADEDPYTPDYDACTQLEYCAKSTSERRRILQRAWRARRSRETHVFGHPLRQAEREPTKSLIAERSKVFWDRAERRTARQTKVYGRPLTPDESQLLIDWGRSYRESRGHSPATSQYVKIFNSLPQKTLDSTPKIPHTTPDLPETPE